MIAQKWFKRLDGVEIHPDGFRRYSRWNRTLTAAISSAVTVSAEEGSHDPNTFLTFEDGSVLKVSNPRQSAFCGQASWEAPASLFVVVRERNPYNNEQETRIEEVPSTWVWPNGQRVSQSEVTGLHGREVARFKTRAEAEAFI